jgi:hypothetical protein
MAVTRIGKRAKARRVAFVLIECLLGNNYFPEVIKS